MKKILVYLPSLHHGGAEGVIVDVVNSLTEYDFQIIIVLAKAEGNLLSRLDSKVEVVDLNLRSQWFSPFKLPQVINRVKPDYILSTLKESNFLAIISRIISFSKARNIIREASTASQQIANENKWYQKIKNKLIFAFYKYASTVIVLSEPMKEDLQSVVINLKEERIRVISNPVNVEKIKARSLEPIDTDELKLLKGRPLFLAVGRLHEPKNYKFLIEALSEYKKQGSDFVCFILGSGSLKAELLKIIETLGLSDCIYLLGYRDNPFKYIRAANVFLMPSLYEGMSNSLIQASSLGIPSIVSDTQETSIYVQKLFGYELAFKADNIHSFIDCLHKYNSLKIESIDKNPFEISGVVDKYRKILN